MSNNLLTEDIFVRFPFFVLGLMLRAPSASLYTWMLSGGIAREMQRSWDGVAGRHGWMTDEC